MAKKTKAGKPPYKVAKRSQLRGRLKTKAGYKMYNAIKASAYKAAKKAGRKNPLKVAQRIAAATTNKVLGKRKAGR